jgi:hypothetical protein
VHIAKEGIRNPAISILRVAAPEWTLLRSAWETLLHTERSHLCLFHIRFKEHLGSRWVLQLLQASYTIRSKDLQKLGRQAFGQQQTVGLIRSPVCGYSYSQHFIRWVQLFLGCVPVCAMGMAGDDLRTPAKPRKAAAAPTPAAAQWLLLSLIVLPFSNSCLHLIMFPFVI